MPKSTIPSLETVSIEEAQRALVNVQYNKTMPGARSRDHQSTARKTLFIQCDVCNGPLLDGVEHTPEQHDKK